MTEQTEGAEVEFWCDECGSETHDTIAHQDYPVRVDWWWSEEGRAKEIAAAEVRGAQAVLAAVEKVYAAGPQPNLYLAVDAARAAAAAAGGGGEA